MRLRSCRWDVEPSLLKKLSYFALCRAALWDICLAASWSLCLVGGCLGEDWHAWWDAKQLRIFYGTRKARCKNSLKSLKTCIQSIIYLPLILRYFCVRRFWTSAYAVWRGKHMAKPTVLPVCQTPLCSLTLWLCPNCRRFLDKKCGDIDCQVYWSLATGQDDTLTLDVCNTAVVLTSSRGAYSLSSTAIWNSTVILPTVEVSGVIGVFGHALRQQCASQYHLGCWKSHTTSKWLQWQCIV